MPDDQVTESVSVQLADVVEIVECGKVESNQYLEAGYVLLAAVGSSSLRKANRANGTPFEWVKRDVRYALGRRSPVSHFTPEKPDWLKEKESPSHCGFVMGNIHCDRTRDHEGPHEGHVRFVFGDGLQPWMALARHEVAGQEPLKGVAVRCGFGSAEVPNQRCILPPYHFGGHNLVGDVGFQEPPVLPGTHEDAAPAAEGEKHCEFAVGVRLCVLRKGHKGPHYYGSARGLGVDEPSAPPAQCSYELTPGAPCVLPAEHGGAHAAFTDGGVFAEPSAPPANEDPGTGVPT